MSHEFKTLIFPVTRVGQEEKIQALRRHANQGWRIESESISGDSYDVDSAVKESLCLCLACGPICSPLGFLGKQRKGMITITLSRSDEERGRYELIQHEREEKMRVHSERVLRETKIKRRERLQWLASLPPERFPALDGNHLGTNLFKALHQYVMNDSPFNPLPDLTKCSRDARGITLRDENGTVLAKYTYNQLKKLPTVEL
jgi:hypothetical protein